jgi:hypothetical protein
MCEQDSESDSDEEMKGGASAASFVKYVSGVARGVMNAAEQLYTFGRLATASEKAAAAALVSKALAAERAAQAAAAAALRTGRTALTNAPSSALTVPTVPRAPPTTLTRAPGTTLSTVPGTRGLPFDASLDLRGLTPKPPTQSVASRLAAMGVSPARVAAALAAGVAVTGLEAYFQRQGLQMPGEGNYDVFGPLGPLGPEGPEGPEGPGGTGGPGGIGGPIVGPPRTPTRPPVGPIIDVARPGVYEPPKPTDLAPGTPKKVVAAYLRSGNAPSRYLVGNQARKMALARSEGALSGAGMVGGRAVRGQQIKKIMQMFSLRLGPASKYLKENGPV